MKLCTTLVAVILAAHAAGHSPDVTSPNPPTGVRLAALTVKAAIVDGAATTELHQVVRNDTGRVAEAIWILPLPAGATADRFTMTVNGVEVESEVLDATRARQTYEAIVRKQRDPGLLEYVGAGCLRARIFPIPAHGQADVVVRYRQVLAETAGLHRWTFPLRAPQIGSMRPESIVVSLSIRSSKPIKNVFSPLPGVDIAVNGDHEARATLELAGHQIPERDLSIFYGLSEREFGLNLLTYRKKGMAPGFFMLMLSPKQSWATDEVLKKSIQFVLDTSGSMQGQKIEQARGALRFFLQSLKPDDQFNVIPFSTQARPFFARPVSAIRENLDEALSKVDDIEARGGTDIGDALSTAFRAEAPATHVPITVFLTDGRPTVGTTGQSQLLEMVGRINQSKQRVFVFGVGHDVNTHLLDTVAAKTRGARDYVAETEDIEVKTGALFTKLSYPVLTDVELRINGVSERDLMPRRMPDLFRGSRLVVLGRYKGHGHTAIRLRGKIGERTEEFIYEGDFALKSTEHDFVPALWAERRVAMLLDAIRLNGQDAELLKEVRRLGTEYGIVTPYTSHLIVEEGTRLATGSGHHRGPGDTVPPGGGGGRSVGPRGPSTPSGRGRVSTPGPSGPATGGPSTPAGPTTGPRGAPRSEAQRARDRLRNLGKQSTGKKAVDDSVSLGALSGSDEFFLGGSRRTEKRGVATLTRRVKDKTFYLVGDVWIDAAFKKEMKGKVEKIEAFSEAYFELLKKEPKLTPYLSFAKRVLVVWEKRAVEITTK